MLTLERICKPQKAAASRSDEPDRTGTYRTPPSTPDPEVVALPTLVEESARAVRTGLSLLLPPLLLLGVGGAGLSAAGDAFAGPGQPPLAEAFGRHLLWYLGWTFGLFAPLVACVLAVEVARLACARRWVGGQPARLASGVLVDPTLARSFVPRSCPEDRRLLGETVAVTAVGDELLVSSATEAPDGPGLSHV